MNAVYILVYFRHNITNIDKLWRAGRHIMHTILSFAEPAIESKRVSYPEGCWPLTHAQILLHYRTSGPKEQYVQSALRNLFTTSSCFENRDSNLRCILLFAFLSLD
jgi:hypothetical protein